MGRITIDIDDDLEKQVRIRVAEKGGKKGDLTKAIEEGMRLWLTQTRMAEVSLSPCQVQRDSWH